VLEEARALPFAWPEPAFCAYLETVEDVGSVRGADLCLAWSCARGDERALATFDAMHAGDIAIAHARARGDKPPLDELVQILRAKLFVGPSPRIAAYRGVGPLRAWVRVVATRTLIEMARRTKATTPLDESGVTRLGLAAPDDDPEMAYLKRRYASDVREAFEVAARALCAEDRNVLREHYVGGLGIDQIAGVHGIHRATAARRLAGAREAVLRGTRQILSERLRLSRGELESMVRMVESRLHVTIERVFA
jgi:RNA polymerase sigma-70 factor (ECF subfamily)